MAGDEGELAGALEEFINRWSLREDSVNLLVTMDPEAQIRVLSEFSPRDTGRDVNGIFLKFAQGVAAGTPRGGRALGSAQGAGTGYTEVSPDVEAFIGQWALGDDATAILLSMDAASQARVIQEFAPRDTSRDVNPIFICFAQGIAKGKGKGKGKDKGKDKGKAKGKGKGLLFPAASAPRPYLTPGNTYRPPAAHTSLPPPAASAGAYPSTDDPQEFIAQWNLDEKSQEMLFALGPEQQTKVMQEFRPRDVSRDVNRIFVRFASGIAEQRERGGPLAAIKAYIEKWSLNEDAQGVLYSMPPEVQAKVMMEFNPRDTSRDVSNIFMKFSQSIAMNFMGFGGDFGKGKGTGKSKGKGRPGPY